MAKITEDYVSFKTAKLLKEKGFDEKCQKVYMHNGQLLWAQIFMEGESFVNNECIDLVAKYNNWVGSDYAFLCPTLQMATKWLREVHKLHISILWDCGAYIGKNSFCYHIDRINNYEDKGYNKIGFDSNEQACEAAIKYCLENLIE